MVQNLPFEDTCAKPISGQNWPTLKNNRFKNNKCLEKKENERNWRTGLESTIITSAQKYSQEYTIHPSNRKYSGALDFLNTYST